MIEVTEYGTIVETSFTEGGEIMICEECREKLADVPTERLFVALTDAEEDLTKVLRALSDTFHSVEVLREEVAERGL